MKLKVCGVMDARFAVAAERLGVDYLGFIFARESPRCVTAAQAADIAARLTERATRVGVFTHSHVDAILETVSRTGIRTIQLHAWYSENEVCRLRDEGLTVWLLDDGPRFRVTAADGIVVDGRQGAQRGGTGIVADWNRARELSASGVFTILAGGLSSANINAAAQIGCAVLDINSSIEVAPGVKSVKRLCDVLDNLPREKVA